MESKVKGPQWQVIEMILAVNVMTVTIHVHFGCGVGNIKL